MVLPPGAQCRIAVMSKGGPAAAGAQGELSRLAAQHGGLELRLEEGGAAARLLAMLSLPLELEPARAAYAALVAWARQADVELVDAEIGKPIDLNFPGILPISLAAQLGRDLPPAGLEGEAAAALLLAETQRRGR